ncbi:MAG: hypothetical protein PUG84_03945 [Peptoniphilaceae bacterium]|nr:hypothetical protein [Peptoniphilaceae bacterium]
MKNLESKKNKKLGINFLLLIIFASQTLIPVGVTFSRTALNSAYFLYELLDAYFFISLLVNPILISSLAKKVIEIEEKNNMWQLQIRLGEKVTDILLNKFKNLSSKLLLLQIIQWILLIVLSEKSKYFVFNMDVIIRLLLLFIAILFINLFFLALFMILEMKTKKVYLTSFLSIIGALSGIICMLTSRLLSYINPFAWISCLMNISYIKEGDKFIKILNPLQYYIPIIALLFLVISIFYMKNMKKFLLEKE